MTYDSTAGPDQACTDDFSAYRLVLAVAGDGNIEFDEEAVPYPGP